MLMMPQAPANFSGAVSAFLVRVKEHPLFRLGPGLITGVADDNSSGIATYSQAGAQFGLNMLRTMPLAFPLMAAIQSMCGRIGRVTGKGLAANIKPAFPPIVLKIVVLLLLVANTLNIAADIAAMGETAELVTGVNRHAMTVLFVLGTLLLQVLVPYRPDSRIRVVLRGRQPAIASGGTKFFVVVRPSTVAERCARCPRPGCLALGIRDLRVQVLSSPHST